MKFTATREAEMKRYEIRVELADGSYEIVTITAGSIQEAARWGTVLCTIDSAPQAFLAW
jgi:hypothetical protein